jgi:hypothetical protein
MTKFRVTYDGDCRDVEADCAEYAAEAAADQMWDDHYSYGNKISFDFLGMEVINLETDEITMVDVNGEAVMQWWGTTVD